MRSFIGIRFLFSVQFPNAHMLDTMLFHKFPSHWLPVYPIGDFPAYANIRISRIGLRVRSKQPWDKWLDRARKPVLTTNRWQWIIGIRSVPQYLVCLENAHNLSGLHVSWRNQPKTHFMKTSIVRYFFLECPCLNDFKVHSSKKPENLSTTNLLYF